jgi:hypothetical protein
MLTFDPAKIDFCACVYMNIIDFPREIIARILPSPQYARMFSRSCRTAAAATQRLFTCSVTTENDTAITRMHTPTSIYYTYDIHPFKEVQITGAYFSRTLRAGLSAVNAHEHFAGDDRQYAVATRRDFSDICKMKHNIVIVVGGIPYFARTRQIDYVADLVGCLRVYRIVRLNVNFDGCPPAQFPGDRACLMWHDNDRHNGDIFETSLPGTEIFGRVAELEPFE